MARNAMLQGAHATVLSMLVNLAHLDVSGCRVSWQVLSSVSVVTNLQQLHVHNIECCLGDNRGMLPDGHLALPKWLLNLPKLVHLGMGACGFDQYVLGVVSRLAALTHLRLDIIWPFDRDYMRTILPRL